MEGHIPHQQRTVQTSSDVLWIMQFARNVPKDDKQHFLRVTS